MASSLAKISVGVVPSQLEVVDGAVVLARCSKVMAEDGGDIGEALGRVRLQVPGRPGVQLAPLRTEQAVVCGVPDEGVMEAVEGFGLAAGLDQKPARDQLGQGGVERPV